MRPIPLKLRTQIATDPFMKRCIHKGCLGEPEWEHCFIYGGKQINEAWAIVPCCTFHHRGSGFDKNFNQYVALCRASPDDLAKYPKKDWATLKTYLNKIYAKN